MGESLLSEVTAKHVKSDKLEIWSFYLMSSFIFEVLICYWMYTAHVTEVVFFHFVKHHKLKYNNFVLFKENTRQFIAGYSG